MKCAQNKQHHVAENHNAIILFLSFHPFCLIFSLDDLLMVFNGSDNKTQSTHSLQTNVCVCVSEKER